MEHFSKTLKRNKTFSNLKFERFFVVNWIKTITGDGLCLEFPSHSVCWKTVHFNFHISTTFAF